MIGCGVVGQGILELLRKNEASIERRLGAEIEVKRVVARRKEKLRKEAVSKDVLSFDPDSVLNDPEIQIVLEVMGGVEPAGTFVRRALESGKHVITANKALLAEHGHELIELAESKGVELYFEASVGGGIPVIRVLRESLASDRVVAIRGIVNGTSNYILSRMRDAGLDFKDALQEAQDAGYAEADPTLDIGGGDAAHKLTILATLAFGGRFKTSDISVDGIERVSAADMKFAERFGYVIKPLAIGRTGDSPDDPVELRVHPALVRKGSVLASVSGALNAIYIEGAMLGPCLLSGLGAGALPTAMSVVSDIVDVGRNILVGARNRVPVRAIPGEDLVERKVAPMAKLRSRYYLRFTVHDHPGVLGRLASVLGDHAVSIEQMVQEGGGTLSEGPVSIVALTHVAYEENIRDAFVVINKFSFVAEPGQFLRIDDA